MENFVVKEESILKIEKKRKRERESHPQAFPKNKKAYVFCPIKYLKFVISPVQKNLSIFHPCKIKMCDVLTQG